MGGKVWHPDEILELIRLYPEGGAPAVSRATGRGENAINKIAQRMRISSDWTGSKRGPRKERPPSTGLTDADVTSMKWV